MAEFRVVLVHGNVDSEKTQNAVHEMFGGNNEVFQHEYHYWDGGCEQALCAQGTPGLTNCLSTDIISAIYDHEDEIGDPPGWTPSDLVFCGKYAPEPTFEVGGHKVIFVGAYNATED